MIVSSLRKRYEIGASPQQSFAWSKRLSFVIESFLNRGRPLLTTFRFQNIE